MGRPKGSKNKPNNISVEEIKNTSVESSIEGFKGSVEEDKITNEFILDNKKESAEKLSEGVNKELEAKTLNSLSSQKTLNKSTNSNKSLPTCDRCHKESQTLNAINLVQLTGLASYYRASKNDKLLLCPECMNRLNKVVDSFLYNNGRGVEKKPWSLTPDEYKDPVEGPLNGLEKVNKDVNRNTAKDVNREDEDFDF